MFSAYVLHFIQKIVNKNFISILWLPISLLLQTRGFYCYAKSTLLCSLYARHVRYSLIWGMWKLGFSKGIVLFTGVLSNSFVLIWQVLRSIMLTQLYLLCFTFFDILNDKSTGSLLLRIRIFCFFISFSSFLLATKWKTLIIVLIWTLLVPCVNMKNGVLCVLQFLSHVGIIKYYLH